MNRRKRATISVQRSTVAHALLRAASTLVSTHGRPCQTANVGTSADTARKSACATRIGFGIVACVALAAAQVAHPPMVPPAGPGVFTVKPSGPGAFKLVVTGHTFTSRGEIEK